MPVKFEILKFTSNRKKKRIYALTHSLPATANNILLAMALSAYGVHWDALSKLARGS